MKDTKDMVFLDLETTGLSAKTDRIIEIGAIRVREDKILDKFESLINPGVYVPNFIEKLTGIRNEDLIDKETFDKVIDLLQKFLDGSIIVAHNAVFDISFLREEHLRSGSVFEYPHFCTVRLSRHLFPEHRGHGLDAIIARHNLQINARHRAIGDAEVTFDYFRLMRERFGEKINEAILKIGNL